MTRPDSPWYISATAVHEYGALLRIDTKIEWRFYRCEDELVAVARVATFEKICHGGLSEYRGAVPVKSRPLLASREHRLVLLVSTDPRPEGNLPQLVHVKLRGQR
jgi:hypothetical protein